MCGDVGDGSTDIACPMGTYMEGDSRRILNLGLSRLIILVGEILLFRIVNVGIVVVLRC